MRNGKWWGSRAALVLVAAMLLTLGVAPVEAKIFGKKKEKEKEKEFVPFVPSGAWEAYIHDNEGRDRMLVQPVEQNDDQDWMFLKFTDYKGPRGRLAIMRVENKSLNPNPRTTRTARSRSRCNRSRTFSRPPCSIRTASL